MKSLKKTLTQTERQQEIKQLLHTLGEGNVNDLAERLGVTTMTIRRDLQSMEESGVILRTHGGCVLQEALVSERSFSNKEVLNLEAKTAIAAKIAQILPSSGSIYLDTGTTSLQVARALASRGNYRVCTNNLRVAMELFGKSGIEVFVPGGKLSSMNPDLTGSYSIEKLKHLYFDVAVLGCDAIDVERGEFYAADEPTMQLSLVVQEHSEKIYLAADSSKFGRHSLYIGGKFTEKLTIITDAELSERKDLHFLRAGTTSSTV